MGLTVARHAARWRGTACRTNRPARSADAPAAPDRLEQDKIIVAEYREVMAQIADLPDILAPS